MTDWLSSTWEASWRPFQYFNLYGLFLGGGALLGALLPGDWIASLHLAYSLPFLLLTVLYLVVVGAGFLAVISLKTKLAAWQVRVLRSPDIGVIRVGQGTTVSFPRFLFDYLRLPQREFYAPRGPAWGLRAASWSNWRRCSRSMPSPEA